MIGGKVFAISRFSLSFSLFSFLSSAFLTRALFRKRLHTAGGCSWEIGTIYRKQDQVNKLLLSDGRGKLAKLPGDLNKASAKKMKRRTLPDYPRPTSSLLFFSESEELNLELS